MCLNLILKFAKIWTWNIDRKICRQQFWSFVLERQNFDIRRGTRSSATDDQKIWKGPQMRPPRISCPVSAINFLLLTLSCNWFSFFERLCRSFISHFAFKVVLDFLIHKSLVFRSPNYAHSWLISQYFEYNVNNGPLFHHFCRFFTVDSKYLNVFILNFWSLDSNPGCRVISDRSVTTSLHLRFCLQLIRTKFSVLRKTFNTDSASLANLPTTYR